MIHYLTDKIQDQFLIPVRQGNVLGGRVEGFGWRGFWGRAWRFIMGGLEMGIFVVLGFYWCCCFCCYSYRCDGGDG